MTLLAGTATTDAEAGVHCGTGRFGAGAGTTSGRQWEQGRGCDLLVEREYEGVLVLAMGVDNQLYQLH
jgi:hypothetical protein